MGVYGGMLLTLWLLFGTDINALIALGVCTVYVAMRGWGRVCGNDKKPPDKRART